MHEDSMHNEAVPKRKVQTMLRVSFFLCATAILATSAPAWAGSVTPETRQAASSQAEEWSSAQKSKRKRAVTVYHEDYQRPYYGWRAADPSFDQNGRPYRNPFPGQCMVDLGYGRFESCDQVGGR
jgi:hypothetical protein